MGFCHDCSDRGYDMCFCKPIKQPNIKFVSEIDTLKKLQEQNKIMREALEFVIKESGSSANYNKMAREALAKIDKQGE